MSVATSTLWEKQRAPRRQDESKFQRATNQLLSTVLPDDALHFAIPNGLMRSKQAAARAKGEGVRAGIPDICVIYRGRAHFIELKTKHGVVSGAQREMIRKLTYCGASVMLCRNLDEVEAALREACVPLKGRVSA